MKSKQAHFACRNCGQNFGFSQDGQNQGKNKGAGFQGQFGNLCNAHQAGSNWGPPNLVPFQVRPAQRMPFDTQ